MEKAGLLENTAIVIYGDHDARLDKKEYQYYYNYNIFNLILQENRIIFC